jgi:hypothetical protein
MTIIGSAELMWSRQTSGADLTENKRKINLGYEQSYQVFTTPDTEITELYYAPGLPAAGTEYPGVRYIYAQRARPRRISPTYWIVDVSYEGETAFTSGGGLGTPMDARPRIRWGVREVEREVDEDWDGNRITNVLGEPLTARVIFYERVATVTRNMLFFNHYAFSAYDFAVNSDPVLGWPAGTCRVKVEAENVFNDVTGYGTVTGTFTFKRPYRTTADKAWYSRIRNDGFYCLPGINPGPGLVGPPVGIAEAVECADKNKVPLTRPGQLDLDGYQLSDGTATWLDFKHFDSLPFSALGILP